jgi:hypothetical protein
MGKQRGATGPTSLAGKARSSRNGLKHGIFSDATAVGSEAPESFDALQRRIEESLKVSGPLEQVLAKDLAILVRRRERLVRAEAALDEDAGDPEDSAPQSKREAKMSEKLKRAHVALAALDDYQDTLRIAFEGADGMGIEHVRSLLDGLTRIMFLNYNLAALRSSDSEHGKTDEVARFLCLPEQEFEAVKDKCLRLLKEAAELQRAHVESIIQVFSERKTRARDLDRLLAETPQAREQRRLERYRQSIDRNIVRCVRTLDEVRTAADRPTRWP